MLSTIARRHNPFRTHSGHKIPKQTAPHIIVDITAKAVKSTLAGRLMLMLILSKYRLTINRTNPKQTNTGIRLSSNVCFVSIKYVGWRY